MRQLIAAGIGLYQRTLSPDHGWLRIFFPNGYCRYCPSCSDYTKGVILKHGTVRGIFMGAWRILRCNPFSSGGVDLVK